MLPILPQKVIGFVLICRSVSHQKQKKTITKIAYMEFLEIQRQWACWRATGCWKKTCANIKCWNEGQTVVSVKKETNVLDVDEIQPNWVQLSYLPHNFSKYKELAWLLRKSEGCYSENIEIS